MKNKEIEELLNYYQKEIDKYEESKKYLMEKYGYDEETIDNISQHQRYKNNKLLLSYIEQLEEENKILKENAEHNDKVVDKVKWENKQLKNNRDKAIEVINTQLKNAEGGIKDNLRIIKFNLIKGSCTFKDLKTEEDYKYILKGDSDYE